MSPRELLRLGLFFALASHPACSVYDSALLNEDVSSSVAGASIGVELTAGAASGGTGEASGTSASAEAGDPGSAGQNGDDSTSAGAGGTSAAASGGAGGCGAAGGAANAGAGGNGASAAAGNGGAGASGAGAAGNAGSGGAAGAAGKGSAGSGGAGGATGGASSVDPCSRRNWLVTASESSPTTTPAQAIDGDGGTRWSSGSAQVGGEWFRIDLGAIAAHLTQIVLDTSASPTDFPVNYKLELSSDGTAYTLVTTGSGSSITTIKLSDRSARYLKLTQTGTSLSWWSIHELSISCQSN